MSNHDLKPETNSFKEIFDYYEFFSNDRSRTSPNSDVKACYKIRVSQYHQKIFLYHHNKKHDKTSEYKVNTVYQYWEIQETMDNVIKAYDYFTGVTAERFSVWKLYEQKCDRVVMSWKFNACFDSYAVRELFKVGKILDKRRTTLSKTIIMTHTEKYIALYNKRGIKPMSGILRYFMQ